ncbi:MAG: acylphosphatase [Termitinemataceae bacterium]|nr:MAG: acylphosphatase [Termitinemataceae bacterium]
MANAAFDAHVFGRVQGVAFRYSAQDEAQGLGITGWVRNADDGSVELHAEGEDVALRKFLDWLKHGPPYAHVKKLNCINVEPSNTYKSFRIVY